MQRGYYLNTILNYPNCLFTKVRDHNSCAIGGMSADLVAGSIVTSNFFNVEYVSGPMNVNKKCHFCTSSILFKRRNCFILSRQSLMLSPCTYASKFPITLTFSLPVNFYVSRVPFSISTFWLFSIRKSSSPILCTLLLANRNAGKI